MTCSEPADWLRDPELVRLRREWVHAYRTWRRLVGETTAIGEVLTDEQREAERRYRDAETAYFTYSRRLTGD
ncbi:MAG: hypothetical protein ACRDQD_20880 [Nocardioidaceae bacterium]